jgi:hypothetical protein
MTLMACLVRKVPEYIQLSGSEEPNSFCSTVPGKEEVLMRFAKSHCYLVFSTVDTGPQTSVHKQQGNQGSDDGSPL